MITYPVSLNVSEWSVHDSGSDSIVVRNRQWPQLDGGEILTLASGLTMLRQVEGTKPAFNPSLEKLERQPEIVDLVANELRVGYAVVSLSVGELAVVSREAQRQSMREDWDALPAHLRGPYRPQFDVVNTLLDEGDDEAAAELLDAIEPTVKVKGNSAKNLEYDEVKTSFAAKLAALPPKA